MMSLNITHTHEAGTLIHGTSKGDGTAALLKANGWRWGRSIGAWYVPRSRDQRPKTLVIDKTRDELEAAGFIVTADIDTTVRSTAEVEAAKIARQDARAEALETKAERKHAKAEAAWETHERAAAALPEGGEPVKIGHHSERRHRRAIDRAHTTMGRSIEASHEAEHATQRARSAAATTAARYSPVTVGNRIEKIEAERRRLRRHLDGHVSHKGTPYAYVVPPATGARREQLLSQLEEQEDALTYWRGIRAQQITAGTAGDYGPDTISKGDYVRLSWGRWHKVVRVNKKSVSVETGYSWTDTVRYHEIKEHRLAADVCPLSPVNNH